MLPGTIIMLIVILTLVYGGAGWLMKLNFEGEKRKKEKVTANDAKRKE
jgi:hypothetical protein